MAYKKIRHHWSYAKENMDDTIAIEPSLHKNVHLKMKKNEFLQCFEVCGVPGYEDGYLLDTKEEHLRFIGVVRDILVKQKISSLTFELEFLLNMY